ncbi:MAG: Bro-N domain-containing protein [Candidatus Uhrbacteria bacterium]|nr:Bro-N domain-containing protein [Candidatus Uhrbacteria bacterium]
MKNSDDKKNVIFEGKQIRRLWDEEKEMWYFSVVDIVQVLTESVNPTDYLKKLRKRDPVLAGYIGTNCPHVEMITESGKKRKTLAGNPEHLFRIIQSIPSKKAEPIKLWLAKVGYERVQEMSDPEKALNRSRDYWQKMGRDQKWIQQRMMGQEVRNKLTDYWKDHEVKEKDEYAILTNIIHQEWSDVSVKQHKSLKNLKTENLRDHMTDAELVFTALAELSTRQIAETMEAKGLEENKIPAKKGGRVAKNARLELEEKTGKKVVSGNSFKLLSARKK